MHLLESFLAQCVSPELSGGYIFKYKFKAIIPEWVCYDF